MLDDRKAAILSAVVTEYIETASPVGSGRVSAARGVDVSSATVRNEMAALEEDGFLYQPHTSAGRVPTEKGYRQFVDGLTEPAALATRDSAQVNAFFAQAHGQLEDLLAHTSGLLADLTDCAAVVVGPDVEDEHVLSSQLVRLSTTTTLMVVVLSGGAVEKRTVEIADDVHDDSVAAAGILLDESTRGLSWSALSNVTFDRESLDDDVARVLDGCFLTLSDARPMDASVFVDGASRVATAFDAVNTVSEVLVILEKQLVVVRLLRDVLDRGMSVAIGSETGVEPLAECSLVVAPYGPEGSTVGTVGVLGPTRMNYPQALAAVAVVSNTLSRTLAED